MVRAFRYIGSKIRLAPIICSLIPEHDIYVEPFAGSAAVLLNKRPSRIEVLNDINGDIYNFFRVCRDPVKFWQLIRKLYYTPYDRQVFAEALEKFKRRKFEDDVDQAWVWKVLTEMSAGWRVLTDVWAGNKSSVTPASWEGGNDMNHRRAAEWRQRVLNLKAVHKRLLTVRIDRRDAIDVITDLDTPKTLFYCDPPYLANTMTDPKTHYSNIDQGNSIDFHKRLVDVLNKLQGMCILSCYWHDVYKLLIDNGWQRLDIKSYARCGKRGGRLRIETLLLSSKVAAYGITPNLL